MTITCGKPPEKIQSTLTLKSPAEKFKIKVTYNNLGTTQLSQLIDDKQHTVGSILLKLIDDWDADYPLSLEGFQAFEDHRPRILEALFAGYHQARQVELEKN